MLRTPQYSSGPSFSTPTSKSRKIEHIELSYELQPRVNVAEFYPVRASNGSRIIIYGHEHGLTCLWRGGTPLEPAVKPASVNNPPVGVNTNSQDDVIMIDDHDEGRFLGVDVDDDVDVNVDVHNPQNNLQNNSQHYWENVDPDSAQPFDSIVHSIDIGLGSSVTHISFAALPPSLSSLADLNAPQIFQKDMVLAVACADGSVHIITIPLSPSTANDSDIKDLVVVESSDSVRDLPRGVSLTWTSALDIPLHSAYPTLYRRRSGEGASGNHSSSMVTPSWSFLISYHTAKKSGLLKVFEVPLNASGLEFVPEKVSRLREIYLHAPAKLIAFNNAPYPSELHTELLVVDNFGTIRIYEPLLRPPPQAALNTEFTAEQLGDAWLASLYTPFEHTKATSQALFHPVRRSKILDAKWVFDGQAVIVLLADGQWGVWDLVGVGPSGSQNRDNPVVNGNRIAGGGVTRFALRGYVGHTGAGVSARPSSASEPAVQPSAAKLAPMTPNTRKAKQDALFNSTAPPRPTSTQRLSTGGMSLSRLVADPAHDGFDESLFMWFNSEVYYTPSLMTYWQQAARTIHPSNKFKEEDNAGTLFGPNLASFHSFTPESEMITSISQAQQQDTPATRTSPIIHGDILMSAEHRLLLFSPVKDSAPTVPLSALFTAPSTQTADDPLLKRRLDQEMLSRGDLDLGGMDKMLESMDRTNSGINGGSRRVEFSLDS